MSSFFGAVLNAAADEAERQIQTRYGAFLARIGLPVNMAPAQAQTPPPIVATPTKDIPWYDRHREALLQKAR